MSRSRSSADLRMATSALKARLGTEMLIMKARTRRKESLMLERVNGPPSKTVPQTAKHARMNATVAVSRGPDRSAAQISGRMAKNASGARLAVCSKRGLKPTMPRANVVAIMAAERSSPSRSSDRGALHNTITGVTTSAPAKSPSHQVIHIGARLGVSAYPARLRLPTPIVALVIVLGPRLIKVNLATFIGVSNVFRPSDHRLIRQPPITAFLVFAKPMAQEVEID